MNYFPRGDGVYVRQKLMPSSIDGVRVAPETSSSADLTARRVGVQLHSARRANHECR